MSRLSAMTPAEDAALVVGMPSIMAAGGLSGFAREVVAETKNRLMEMLRAGQCKPSELGGAEVMEAASAIAMRRIGPDTARLGEQLRAQYRVAASGPDPIEAMRAIDADLDAFERRQMLLADRIGAHLLEALR